MNRWTLTISAMLFAVARTAIAAEALPSTEPAHNGKPVTYWVAALEPARSFSTQSKQVEAEEAIHALGPEAIPFILRYQDRNRDQRLRLIRHACGLLGPEGDLKLVEALHDTDETVRETALEVLPKTVLPAALDDIVTLLTDPVRPVRNAAILALVRLAPNREETIGALVDALHDHRPAVADAADFSRADAALTLGTLGSKAKAAIPELTELLTDSDDAAREAAAVALWKIERNPQVIPVLIEQLENAREYQTCIRVLKILAEIGPRAKSAVPVIQKKIEDPELSFVPPNLDFGKVAVDALAKIDPVAARESRKKLLDAKESQ